MTDEQERRRRARLRWITLGEAIAIAALVLSGLGLWHEWNQREDKGPTEVVEKRAAIPLTLRARSEDDGRTLVISPVESSHALESLTIAVPTSGSAIEVGSDGELSSKAIESALNTVGDRDKRTHALNVRIEANYVEMGVSRHSSGNYRLRYRWEGGGLFGGRSLRLVGLSR